jgi:hypothetical protein
VSGFAYGEDADFRKSAEVKLSIGAAQSVTREREAAFDGGAGIDGFEGTAEDLASELFAVHRWKYRRLRKETK